MSELNSLLQFMYLAPVGIIEADLETGRIIKINPFATEVLQSCQPDEAVLNLYHSMRGIYPALESTLKGADEIGLVLDNEHLDLSTSSGGLDKRFMSLTVHKVSTESVAVVITNVTKLIEQERELRIREAQLRAIVNSVQAHMIVPIDVNGNIEEFNQSIARLTELSPSIVGSPASNLFQEEVEVSDLLQRTESQGWTELSGPMVHANNKSWWGSSVLTRIINEENQTVGYSLITRDDTTRHQREKLLMKWAEQDTLTGVSNRRAFRSIVDKALKELDAKGGSLSFVLLDIDHFKSVNDTYGHNVGDEVLRELAKRLKCCVRGPDQIVRMGGEEFGVLLPNTNVEQAYIVAERARKLVADSVFVTEVQSLPITISIGVVSTSQCFEKSFKWMYKAADIAMYRAKNLGRNQVQVATVEEIKRALSES